MLYVDDEEINLLLFKHTFDTKYDIYSATSGQEGLAMLDENPGIDIVISDMRMFGMNGVEFVSQAKDKYPEKAYFILTGFVFGEEIEEAIRTNLVRKSFSKPFDQNQIEEAILEATS